MKKYVGNIVDHDLSDLIADKGTLIDIILRHGQQLLFVGHTQNQGQTGSVTDTKDLILWDGEDHIGKGVIAQTSDTTAMDLIAYNILITCFLDLHEVYHSVI